MKRTPLILLLLSSTALAQTPPSTAQMGIDHLSTPEVLKALDNTKTWVPLGSIDPASHAFTAYGAGGTDVRSFGCAADGATDQAACINNAIAMAPGCVIIPPTTSGFYVAPGSTINAKACLKGAFYNPAPDGGPTPSLSVFAGEPWIKCGTSATSVCVKTTYAGAYIAGLTIAAQFPPVVGSIGLQVAGGYNSQIRDVHVSGFDSCAYWLSGTAGGISSHAIGLNLSWCQTYYAVDDGWPELYFTDGRWGSNGQGATAVTPKAALYITKTQNGGAGSGPNSLVMTNVQVNPGGGYVECMVKWGGWTGTGGGKRQFKFIGNHWEFLAPTPGAPARHGVFCSDSTVPLIAQLSVTNSEMGFDGAGGGGLFDLDPATAVENMNINDSFFGVDNFTLAFTSGGLASTGNQITNNFIGGPVHLTGNSTRRLAMSNNILGSLTLDGTWGRFSSSFDQFGTTIDAGSARGSVAMANVVMSTWTPVVRFGGTPSTLAWTVGGLHQRTPSGGFTASFNVLGPASGTEGSHGITTITGLPYKCGSTFTGNPPYIQAGFTAGVGTITLRPDSSDPTIINVYKAGSVGFVNTTDADFTNASNLAGVITCGSAS